MNTPNCFDLTMSEDELNNMSSLALAYIGDTVFDLLVRLKLCTDGRCTSGTMHRYAVKYVNAGAQAAYMEKIRPMLTEREERVFLRGRNSHVGTIPKNAKAGTYHIATGFEALLGDLYLRGEKARIDELFTAMMEDDDAT